MPSKKKTKAGSGVNGGDVNQSVTEDQAGLDRNVTEDMREFQRNQFVVNEDDDEPSVRIDVHPMKGRILVATDSLMPGDIVFKEKAFVVASWNEFHCIECMKPHKPTKCKRVQARYSTVLRENLPAVERALADLEMVGEIDRARTFLKVMLMLRSNPDSKPIQDFVQLATVNAAECVECVSEMRRKRILNTCRVIPENVTDLQAAQVLSILNCNSHEIEDVGGSGVFLQASMMEHSCTPNCNFVTQNDEIFVVCIAPVRPGEALSIDYSQTFYRPTVDRQQALMRSHGFLCSCPMCTTAPDKCRAFHCPVAARNRAAGLLPASTNSARPLTVGDGAFKPLIVSSSSSSSSSLTGPSTSGATGLDGRGVTVCVDGIVSPLGQGLSLSDWKCLTCGYQLTQNEVDMCKNTEKNHPIPPENDDDELPADEDADAQLDAEIAEITGGTVSLTDLSPSSKHPKSLEDVEKIIEEGIMHESHATIFHALLKEAHILARLASSAASVSAGNSSNNNEEMKGSENGGMGDEDGDVMMGGDNDDGDMYYGGGNDIGNDDDNDDSWMDDPKKKKKQSIKNGKKGKTQRKSGSNNTNTKNSSNNNKEKNDNTPVYKESNEARKRRIDYYRRARAVWERVLKCAQRVLPPYCNDTCNFFDHIAQVCVAGRDFASAQKFWQKAYEMSCIIAGKRTKQTLQLKKLYRKPPRSVEELMFHYNTMDHVIDQIEYEEDVTSAKLVVQLADVSMAQSVSDDDDNDDDYDGDGDGVDGDDADDDMLAAMMMGGNAKSSGSGSGGNRSNTNVESKESGNNNKGKGKKKVVKPADLSDDDDDDDDEDGDDIGNYLESMADTVNKTMIPRQQQQQGNAFGGINLSGFGSGNANGLFEMANNSGYGSG